MAEDKIIGKRIGQIEISDKIGQGGMGAVYKGVHHFLGKDVAVKFLSPALVENRQFIDRFIREAQTLAQVEHDNLVRVFDAGEWEGTFYIVMEFIKGRSVGDILKTTSGMPVKQAIAIIKGCAEGLRAASKNKIIHRDIKPDNIMIMDDGGVKLTDFGLAKSTESAIEITQTGQLMGTPHYMSPEQCEGIEVDFRSDIYSLGATFYRLVTGTFPYTGNTPFAVMRKHLQEPLTPPSTVVSSIPKNVSEIIERMMAKKPEHRFASYDELINDLTAIEQGIPIDNQLATTFTDLPSDTGAQQEAAGTTPTIIEQTPPSGQMGSGTAPTLKGDAASAGGSGVASTSVTEDQLGTSPTLITSKKKTLWIIAGSSVAVVVLIAVILIARGGGSGDIPKGNSAEGTQTVVDTVGKESSGSEQQDTRKETESGTKRVETDIPKQNFERAVQLMNEGNINKALVLFKGIINNYSDSEYFDTALDHATQIEDKKVEIVQGIKAIEQFIAEFNIEEAGKLFKSLGLDKSNVSKHKKIAQKIGELREPVMKIDMFLEMGESFLTSGHYEKAVEKLTKAKETGKQINYDLSHIEQLIASADAGLKSETFKDIQAKVMSSLKEFNIIEAERMLEELKENEGLYSLVQEKVNALKKKIKEIRSLRIEGLEMMNAGDYEKAYTKLKESKKKAREISYTLVRFDTLIARASEGMKELNEYMKSFNQAKGFFDTKNYSKAIEFAKLAFSMKESDEAKDLIDEAARMIGEMKEKFKVNKDKLLGWISKKEYNKAMEILSKLTGYAVFPADRLFINDKTKELEGYLGKLAETAKIKRVQGMKYITDNTRNTLMVLIPAGDTIIGNSKGPSQSKPEHKVSISAFYIDVMEVTNKQYEMFDPTHKKKRLPGADRDDIPVTNITWGEATAYGEWLSGKEGVVYRLPSEAEWEKAAKCGKNYKYSYGDNYDDKANLSSTMPVPFNAYPPNKYGLYNMSGNVWEFCRDWVGRYSAKSRKNPVNNTPGNLKVRSIRGGSFSMKSPKVTATTYFRYGVSPDKSGPDKGFRCVRESK